MSAADKYGSPAESISSESLSQAKEAGQKLADNGVKQESSLGTGAPAPHRHSNTAATTRRRAS